MNFIAPIAALIGLLAIPIILLYMLRLRRREVQVSSTLLWQQILRDREANAPWQKLRRNLLLLIQLLILAALVIALMRPYIEVPTVTSGRTALLIDASASMNATDVQPSRFEDARRKALEIVDRLAQGDTLAIIRVAQGPEMLQSYTDNRDLLRAAILDMKPSTAVADWNAALTLAVAGAQGAQQFQVVVIGDGGIPKEVSGSAYGEVRFVAVGNADANVGISALSTANDLVSGPQIYARLTNSGSQDAPVILSIKLDGQLFNANPYTVKSKNYTDVVVSGLPKEFQQVQAELTSPAGSTVPDYNPIDDVAWAIYNPASAGRAVIMTKGNRFIEQGLASLPEWKVARADPANGLPAGLFDLFVFDGWLPDKLPETNMLLLNPPADSPALKGLLTIGELTRRTKIARVRADDARTRYLNFNDVNVLQFRQTSDAAWAVPLVEAEGGPLVLAGESNGRRIAIFTFDLVESDLPLKIAWPILLANLTEWYKSPQAVRLQSGVQPGQTVPIQPSTNATLVRVSRPDGAVTTLAVDRPLLVYADTAQPGIYTVDVYRESQLLQKEFFAVNLFDQNETDITPRTPAVTSSGAASVSQQEIGQQEFWPWIALLAIAFLALEWWIHFRRLGAPRLRPEPLLRFGRTLRRR